MKRYCMVIELKEEFIDKYKEIHLNPWPELLKAEKDCGFSEELIWVYKNFAILYVECDDLSESFKKVAVNKVEKKWDKAVSKWFKTITLFDDTTKIPILEKVFDLNQQIRGEFNPY